MDLSLHYSPGFPEQNKVKDMDIATLYHEGRLEELDEVAICKDKDGRVTAIFGQSKWDCSPFNQKKEGNHLSFDKFNANPRLQRELKIIAFGFLFNKSPQKKKVQKFSSVLSRLTSLKIVFLFLAKNNHRSLKALSRPVVWAKFKNFLQEKGYVQSSLTRVFGSINAVMSLASWHRLDLGIMLIRPEIEAKRISDKDKQQTIIIPERLCDAIYAKAIALVSAAHPYRNLIANTENALQVNYIEGKRKLDEKVNQGKRYNFKNKDGSINNRKYTTAINDNLPQGVKAIIRAQAKKLPNISLENGHDFRCYLGQLITACYIICGGFSGMRDSEIDKLTPNSYYKDTVGGKEYHMLQSYTFKLGEKKGTWVTASSAKLAIELMATLTERWRKEVNYPNKKYANSLWVNQILRSKPPVIITTWSKRLQLFCKQFNFIVTEDDYRECLECNPRSLERIRKYVKVGEPWHMTTHQFRRTLAFYCVKNRLGTLVALKQQFKHLSLSMTEWYTNGGKLASLRGLKVDTKIQQTLADINAETIANIIFKQWHSDETLSGVHGKAIMKMRGDVPTIYSSWDVIYKAVKEGKLTLHGSLHSYCKSGYDCDMGGIVAPQFCVECSSGSSIIDEQQAKWWQKKHRSLTSYMALGEDISVTERSHYITQIRAAENVMRDFNMNFTPFEPELKVIEL